MELFDKGENVRFLQICLDSGIEKVLIPSVTFVHFASILANLMSAFWLILYHSAEDSFFKALEAE